MSETTIEMPAAVAAAPPSATRAAESPLPALYAIRQVRRETADTFTIEIAPADGSPLPAYAPGQFNMMWVPGVGEVPISISGDPAVTDVFVHTIRDVGAVTGAIRRLTVGDLIGIRGPFGAGWPLDACQGRDVVIVAGGIGLAPLRPAVYHLAANRDRYGRVVLLYGCRTSAELLFRKQIAAWRARLDMHVYVTVDRSVGRWHGHVGVVTRLLPQAPFVPERTTAMVCGPEVMMRFTAMMLAERGVPADNIYLSMERNMKCGVGVCGHCQYGPLFVCKDGPVLRYDRIQQMLSRREV